jgi:hypothetical protein
MKDSKCELKERKNKTNSIPSWPSVLINQVWKLIYLKQKLRLIKYGANVQSGVFATVLLILILSRH